MAPCLASTETTHVDIRKEKAFGPTKFRLCASAAMVENMEFLNLYIILLDLDHRYTHTHKYCCAGLHMGRRSGDFRIRLATVCTEQTWGDNMTSSVHFM